MKTAQIIPFSFENHEVRSLLTGDQPWFFAVDVCAALTLSDTNKALIGLDEDEKREHEQYSGSGRKPTLINESGLYSLILRSRKPEAKRFKKWVTAEVLPAIRKHGRYEDSDSRMETLLDNTIGTDGFHMLGAVLDGKVRHLPVKARQRAKMHVWSQVHKAFSVVSAEDIPADQLDVARNFIAAYAIKGEWLGKGEAAAFTVTERQAAQIGSLLHSVAWVWHRWSQGISQGIAALNPVLYGVTHEHVEEMARLGRTLDRDLSGLLEGSELHRRLGGVRPPEGASRSLVI
jgi:prophage antirepressor-like protein